MTVNKQQLAKMSMSEILDFVTDSPKQNKVNFKEVPNRRLIHRERVEKVNSDEYIEQGYYVRKIDSGVRVDKVGIKLHKMMTK
jgi:hypothetical protein